MLTYKHEVKENKMEKKKIVSGMRTTGKLHLGHYMGVLTNWVDLQEDYDCYFFAADWHALTTKYDKTENLKSDTREVVMDWLASGLDPNKSTIYVQSMLPQTAELHIYLSMITPQNWVERDPTLKDMSKIIRGDGSGAKTDTISYGLLGYPVLMSADILTFNADVVPVGHDQLAHLEITRDIARRFNNIYKTDFFKEPAPKLTQVPLLCGVDGQKMGKSFNNDIKISDTEEITTQKIMKCITDRSRVRKDDKGHPEQCEVAFKYYQIFANEEETKCCAQECSAGTRGCADCKRNLAKIINEKFEPIREKRAELSKNPTLVDDILKEGAKKAQVKAQRNIDKIREIINIY